MNQVIAKNLLIIFLLAAFVGCSTQNSEDILSQKKETDLMSINSALRVIDFNGGMAIAHREIRNTSAEVIELTLPDSVYELSVKYELSRIVVEPEFIYFVRGGFKGMTYGLVFSSVPKDRLNGFYEFELVRQQDSTHYWYLVSSRFY